MQNRARVTGFQNADRTAREPRLPELPSPAWVCAVAASDDLRSLLSWPSLNKHVRIAQKTESVNTVLGAGGEARCSGRLHPPSLGASGPVLSFAAFGAFRAPGGRKRPCLHLGEIPVYRNQLCDNHKGSPINSGLESPELD